MELIFPKCGALEDLRPAAENYVNYNRTPSNRRVSRFTLSGYYNERRTRMNGHEQIDILSSRPANGDIRLRRSVLSKRPSSYYNDQNAFFLIE